MKLDFAKAVQWTEGDRTHVGHFAMVQHCGVTGPYTTRCGWLIRHAHTGELEAVDEDLLTNYPSEPTSPARAQGKS